MRFYVDSKVPPVEKGDKYSQLPVPESSMVFRLSPLGRGYQMSPVSSVYSIRAAI